MSDDNKTMSSEVMGKLAGGIDMVINDGDLAKRKNGFILLVFPFNGKGNAEYVSNVKSEDIGRIIIDQAEKMRRKMT